MKEYNIPIDAALEVIGGKWKAVILYYLIRGTRRTNELKRLIPGITQKMLTQQLRELEEDGIILRKWYDQMPPKVEYSLTDYGRTLEPILTALCLWGQRHIKCTNPGEEPVFPHRAMEQCVLQVKRKTPMKGCVSE